MVNYFSILSKSKIARFGIAGLASIGIDFFIYNTLLFLAGLDVRAAKALGFVAGSLNSFILHRCYTFNVLDQVKKRIAKFYGVYLTSLILNNVVNYTLITMWIGDLDKERIIFAFLIASAISVLWNYIGLNLIVFNKKIDQSKIKTQQSK